MNGTRDVKPKARRNLRILIVAAAIVVLSPIAIATVATQLAFPQLFGSACGCAATPTPRDPNWTPTPPPPVSPEDAAVRASRFAGVNLTPNLDWTSVAGRPLSEPYGGGAIAFVDGNTGAVLEVVLEKQLPDSDTASVSAEAALGTAEAFLSRGGATADGLAAQTQLVHGASVAYYDVTWSAPGAGKTVLEIRVNASSGAVFAYRDLRSGIELSAPIVGRNAAIRLAQESTYASGETPDGPEMQSPDLQAYLDSWTWTVGFPDGVLFVDAVTGEVSVGKWSSR